MPNKTTRNTLVVGAVIILLVSMVWWSSKVWIEWNFPISADQSGTWAIRGQFGDMFGAVNSLMSAWSLALLVFAAMLQVRESHQQNETTKWQINYSYLLEAKKSIIEHPEVLALHGIDHEKLLRKHTPAQVSYVLIDLKAADLFYKIEGRAEVQLTEYRLHALKVKAYREIASTLLKDGCLLNPSPFTKALLDEIDRLDM